MRYLPLLKYNVLYFPKRLQSTSTYHDQSYMREIGMKIFEFTLILTAGSFALQLGALKRDKQELVDCFNSKRRKLNNEINALEQRLHDLSRVNSSVEITSPDHQLIKVEEGDDIVLPKNLVIY